MKRFILTGAPGAGKTTIIRLLAGQGFDTVPEAATDIIAHDQMKGIGEPWTCPGFVDAIARLQEKRIDMAAGAVQFHDRSPVCTYALARHLGVPVPAALERLLDRIAGGRIFQPRVFFVESLDVIEHTPARRISIEDARTFGALHARIYDDLGYERIAIPPGSPQDRAAQVHARAVT
ncbi:MAG: AAA family ATPase [Pseudomonadota bacterium]